MPANSTRAARSPTLSPVRAALATPGLAWLLTCSLIARLPFGAVSILLLLRARDLGASYPAAGLVVGVNAVSAGLSEPAIARFTDRVGQSKVLAILIPANVLSFFAAAAIPSSWPVAVLALAGATIAVSFAQVGGLLRALMLGLLDDAHERHAAFALDSGVVELQVVIGPLLLVTAVAGATSPSIGLALGGVISAIGTTGFGLTRASRQWRPTPRDAGAAPDPLATRLFLTLVAIMLLLGLGFGAIEVGITAFADHHGHRSLAGVFAALSATGSLVGALVSARAGAARNVPAQLTMLVAFQAVTLALLAMPSSLTLMGVLVAVNGVAIAPSIATIYGAAATTVPGSRVTEGYGWLGLAVNVGASLGAVVAGSLTTDTSTAAGFIAAAMILGAGCALTARPLAGALRPIGPPAV